MPGITDKLQASPRRSWHDAVPARMTLSCNKSWCLNSHPDNHISSSVTYSGLLVKLSCGGLGCFFLSEGNIEQKPAYVH